MAKGHPKGKPKAALGKRQLSSEPEVPPFSGTHPVPGMLPSSVPATCTSFTLSKLTLGISDDFLCQGYSQQIREEKERISTISLALY